MTEPLPIGIVPHVAWFRLYCYGCGHFFAWAAAHGQILPKNCPKCVKTSCGRRDSSQHDPR